MQLALCHQNEAVAASASQGRGLTSDRGDLCGLLTGCWEDAVGFRLHPLQEIHRPLLCLLLDETSGF